MKFQLFLKAAVGLIAVSSLEGAHAQVRVETNNVPVRMISEPWAATEGPGRPSAGGGFLVPPPQTWTDFLNAENGRNLPSLFTQAETDSTNSLVGQVFPGPADAVPPDSQIAAGPDHLVSLVNSVVAILTKSGTVISTTGLNSFFQSLVGNGCGCFDSRILYAQTNDRFILSTSMRGSTSAILLAVSQTSDPTGNWNKFAINPSTSHWYDFPTLGLSSSAVYLASDVIPNSGPGATFEIIVVGLAELLTGNSNLSITDFQNIASSGAIQGAVTYGNSPTEFLLQSTGQGTVLHVYMINTAGTPALTTSDVTVPFYTQPPPFAPQPGAGQLINSPDDMLSAVWRDNSLWTAHTVASDDGSSGVVRWYEIDASSNTVKQMGTVSGAGNADYGVITVLPDGEATMIYTTSSATQFASAGYAHRSPSDPAGTMPVSGIYQAGTTTYSVSRWGDYSGVSPDPDGKSVWGIAELALTSNTTSTSIAQVLSTGQPPSGADFELSSTPGSNTVMQGQSAMYTITVTPQSGFQAAVAFSCTGLPADTNCSFSPSSLTPGPKPASAQLTITTAAPRSAMFFPTSIFTAVAMGTLWIPVAGLLQRHRHRKFYWTVAVMLALAVCVLGQIGCGGIGSQANNAMPPSPPAPPPPLPPPPTGGTPTGTYTVTVVGNSGSLEHSTSLILIVK